MGSPKLGFWLCSLLYLYFIDSVREIFVGPFPRALLSGLWAYITVSFDCMEKGHLESICLIESGVEKAQKEALLGYLLLVWRNDGDDSLGHGETMAQCF